jgi:uncharacterized membrane protein YcaP (DUF421 family)
MPCAGQNGSNDDRRKTGAKAMLIPVDWKSMFVPTVSIVEIILRGTLIYLALFILMRLVRREAGGLGIADVLVVVMIADASQNAMASDYKSITEGIVLVGTIFFWDYILDYLAYHFPRLRPLLMPRPLPLIKDGQMMRRNMRRELISVEELKAHLREEGVEEIALVKKCFMESNGHISIIKKEADDAETKASH